MGEDSTDDGVTLLVEGNHIDDGESYHTPLGNPNNSVAVFSKQDDLWSIINDSGEAIQVTDLTLTVGDGVMGEEFELRDSDFDEFEFEGVEIADGDTFDFSTRFYPVETTVRTATLAFTYDDDERHAIRLQGEGHLVAGQDDDASLDAEFFGDPEQTQNFTWGGADSDELMGAAVGDDDGNLYFSANAEMLINKFEKDLVVGRFDGEGGLDWINVMTEDNLVRSRDPGQNGETGGATGHLAYGSDGYLYFTAAQAASSRGNTFLVVVNKVDPDDGSIVWSRSWSRTDDIRRASDSSEPYGLDASSDDRVYVTGVTEADQQTLVLALDKSDGSVVFHRELNIVDMSNDRGYAIRYDGDDALYLGGLSDGDGYLARLTGVADDDPELDWAQRGGLGTGSNVNSLDVDEEGNAIAALDIRGADTNFVYASFAPDGSRNWAKDYTASRTDKDNINNVQLIDGDLYASGRIGAGDKQFGDGLVLKADPADGSVDWSTWHFSGKSKDVLAEYRAKGVTLAGDQLIVGVQAYTAPHNFQRYAGYWYDGAWEAEEYSFGEMEDATEQTVLGVVEDGQAVEPGTEPAPEYRYEDPPDFAEFHPAEENEGDGSDGELLFSVVDL